MKLTVAIPTFNRSQRLGRLLSVLEGDSFPVSETEILIIDNCSDDGTDALVADFCQRIPSLRYLCNSENVGMANNFINCMKMAKGEFTWIVGDDDLLIPGGIERLHRYIEENPDVDFFLSSLTILTDGDFKEGIPDSAKLHEPRYRRWKSDRPVLWDELIDPLVDEVFLGALMISVYRSAVLLPKLATEPFTEPYRFTSLETSYPHALLYGNSFVGRQAFYIAEPLVAAVEWKKEWSRYTPMMVTCRLNQLLDHYQDAGVDAERITRCRRFLFQSYGATFWKIAFEREERYRQEFSVYRQISLYWKYYGFWKAILFDSLLRRPWRRITRVAKRVGKKILRYQS